MRAMTMLNERGDQTIVWSEDSDEAMREIIEKKMKQGVSFFIVEPRFFGLLAPKMTKIENAGQAMKHRALSIPDADFRKFVESGSGELTETPKAPVKTVRKAKDAADAASNQTVGVRPMQGG